MNGRSIAHAYVIAEEPAVTLTRVIRAPDSGRPGRGRPVVPLPPGLDDQPLRQPVDGQVFGRQSPPGWRVWPQRPRLRAFEVVAHRNPLALRDHVRDRLAGVREGVELALQEPLEVIAAAHRRRDGGVAVPDERRSHEVVETLSIVGIDGRHERLDDGGVPLGLRITHRPEYWSTRTTSPARPAEWRSPSHARSGTSDRDHRSDRRVLSRRDESVSTRCRPPVQRPLGSPLSPTARLVRRARCRWSRTDLDKRRGQRGSRFRPPGASPTRSRAARWRPVVHRMGRQSHRSRHPGWRHP